MQEDQVRALAMRQVDTVYRLAYHLPGHPHDADELVVETFRIVLDSAPDVEPTERGVRAFLFQILYGAARRRSQAAPPRPPASVAQDGVAAALGSDPSPPALDLSGVDWRHADEQIGRTIRELPLAHRAAFLLCTVENFRYREASGVMGVSVEEVIALLHEARTLMSARLARPAPARPDKANPPYS